MLSFAPLLRTRICCSCELYTGQWDVARFIHGFMQSNTETAHKHHQVCSSSVLWRNEGW